MLFLKNTWTTSLMWWKNKVRKTPDIPPRRKTSLPAMERKLAAARGVESEPAFNKKES